MTVFSGFFRLDYVESAIALSVLFVSLNNVFSFIPGHRWKFAAFFGLIHGMGFASVLGELGLKSSNIFVTLLGFNLGVEIGQLAIVVILIPALFWARRYSFYQRFVLVGGSFACAVISFCWLVDRLGNFNFMPF